MQERELYNSTNLTQSLTEVFTTIGETAYKSEIPICFFIDEIQYMKATELGSLIAALHRTNQLGYPVMIIGAGLPKIYKKFGIGQLCFENKRLSIFYSTIMPNRV